MIPPGSPEAAGTLGVSSSSPGQVPTGLARRRGRKVERLGAWIADKMERFFVVWAILNTTGAMLTPQPGASNFETAGKSLTDSVFSLIYLVIVMLIVLRLGRVMWAGMAHRLTLVLLAVAVLSFFWSGAPDITARRAIAILTTSAFGWYLVARFSGREILQLMALALGFSAVQSLVYGVLRPDIVMLPQEGIAWRGVYENKNTFARAMVLSTLVFLLLAIDGTRLRKLYLGSAVLSALLVLRSTSATGVAVLLLMVGLLKFSKNLRLRMTVLVPVLIGTVFAVAGGLYWLHLHAVAVAAGVGKDATMTGRTDLWAVALEMIAQRPVLGYGYGAFWRPGGPEVSFWSAVGWKTPHSHNGFVDLTLDLGLLGLVVLLAALGTGFAAAIRRARARWSSDHVAPLVLLAFVVCYNITESSMLKHNTVFWLAYIVATSLACGGGDVAWTRRRGGGRARRVRMRPAG